jgi:hypothetical protein
MTGPVRPIYTATGRKVGEVRGSILCREMSASKHMLRRPPAWAIDCDALDAAERAGATHCTIFETDAQRFYRCSIATWRARGFRLDRGHGTQLGLEIKHWGTTDSPAGRQLKMDL